MELSQIIAALNSVGIETFGDAVLAVVMLAGLSTMFPAVRRKLLGNGKCVSQKAFEKHQEEDHKKWEALAKRVEEALKAIHDDIGKVHERIDDLYKRDQK